jgi:hypothetical protein
MKIGVDCGTAALVILAFGALGSRAELPVPEESPSKISVSPPVETPETTIVKWPERPRSEARVMIAKYGEPSTFDDKSLVWYDNGPWQQSVVYRTAPQSLLGFRGKDILEQSIAYDVPDARLAALKSFDSRISFDKSNKKLSARSENENLNYLVFNLADEIVNGKRTVDEARDFYRKTVKLSEAGKSSSYMDGFLFPVSR